MKQGIIFRKAKISDAVKIKKTIDAYAKDGVMLFRPIYEIYGNIRDFFIAEKEKKVIGCCALHVLGKEYRPGGHGSVLAEVRSLAVLKDEHGNGVGTQMIRECINEAKAMGIDKLFTLTTKKNVPFFQNIGFKKTDKATLPQKIWQECINCSRFPADCNEISLIKDI
ncbi:MAG: N-acetyltransferase [Candidatus Nealsonbacteria bacterium]